MTESQTPAKRDDGAATVSIDDCGLVHVDGAPQFRRLVRARVVVIQFRDRSALRSQGRGTELIEVPLSALVDKLKGT